MSFYKIRSESDHWCGCWEEVYVSLLDNEDLDTKIGENEDYVREELVPYFSPEDEDWFEDYDRVSSTIEEVTEDEYLRNKS
jgi:hypothetical protein